MQVREVLVKYKNKRKYNDPITAPENASNLIRSILPDNSREHFIAVYLDGAHQPCGYSVISTGTANSSMVHPREVLQRAVILGAVSMIIGHNHPSDTLKISDEDRSVTNKLVEACKILGIKLLDHIIVTNNNFVSFQEKGLI